MTVFHDQLMVTNGNCTRRSIAIRLKFYDFNMTRMLLSMTSLYNAVFLECSILRQWVIE